MGQYTENKQINLHHQNNHSDFLFALELTALNYLRFIPPNPTPNKQLTMFSGFSAQSLLPF